MSIADVGYIFNYKGTLYPLRLDSFDQPVEFERIGDVPKSLVELCSEKIVLDGTSTARALDAIPSELCYSLMKAALVTARDRAIQACDDIK